MTTAKQDMLDLAQRVSKFLVTHHRALNAELANRLHLIRDYFKEEAAKMPAQRRSPTEDKTRT